MNDSQANYRISRASGDMNLLATNLMDLTAEPEKFRDFVNSLDVTSLSKAFEKLSEVINLSFALPNSRVNGDTEIPHYIKERDKVIEKHFSHSKPASRYRTSTQYDIRFINMCGNLVPVDEKGRVDPEYAQKKIREHKKNNI